MNKKGQSLLEIILAMAIFALISATMVSLSTGGFVSLGVGGEHTEAQAFGTEGIEAVRAIRDRAWNELTFTTSSVATSSGGWIFSGENTTAQFGVYKRIISMELVCRDASNNIATCPASYTDIQTKKVTSQIEWPVRNTTNTVKQVSYLTNWDSLNWTQTDWSGGNGQATWSDITKYDSDDSNVDISQMGEVKLKTAVGSGCGVTASSFDNAGNYNYNATKIIVTSSLAQLYSSGGTGLDANTQGMWHLDEASGSLMDVSVNNNNLTNVKGSPLYSQSGKFATALSFGGNSSRYINNGQQTGLNFTGSFTLDAWIYKTSPAVTYEAIISKWRETGNKRSYALVINSSNQLELWVSSDGTVVTTLGSTTTVPINQWVHISGVYSGSNLYIFQDGVLLNSVAYSSGIADQAAFFSISGADVFNGGDSFFNGKIDEVRASNVAIWTSGFTVPVSAYGSGAYATDKPTIYPVVPHTVATSSAFAWNSFTETATKNGGQIYYQLSSDGGSTWQYWDGSAWATVVGATDYNASSIINTNLSTFSTSTGSIMFKAFLESDGTQLVQLDKVEISCADYADSTFTNSNDYIYSSSTIEFVSSKAQLKDTGPGGSCSGTATACSVLSSTSTCQAQNICSWGGGFSSSTVNSSFTTGIGSPWLTGSSAGVTRTLQATGGNPTQFYRAVFPSTRNVIYDFYITQPFTVTSTVSSAIISLNHIVSAYSGAADSITFYAYVDTISGSYGTPVWTSTNQTGVTAWASVTNINATSKITGAGTYYFKVRGVVDYKNTGTNRTYTLGFDNVLLTWSKNSTCSGTATACNTYGTSPSCSGQSGCAWSAGISYDTNRPTVNPIAPQTVSTSSLSAWSYFTETANKNGGEIYYQLSSDGGTNWLYWDGGAWASAGPTNYNTATVVNSNIGLFTTSTGSLLFKAFLESNGTQLVQLDNVRIGWGETVGEGSGFAIFGYFMSSAYNMSPPAGGSPVQILSWNETNPGCSGCDVKMQLRVAPDSGGTPGTWGSWYGASGVDTYYTDPMAILLPTALNWKQWVQYRAELSGDGVSTPILSDITINYK